jgi:hypothetical protein
MGWGWEADAEVVGIAILVAADAAAFLSGTNPSLFTIRTFRSSKVSAIDQQNTRHDIQIGTVIGSVMAVGAGFGGSLVTKSWLPLAAAIGALIILDGAYMWALANPHDTRGSIA